MGLQYRPKISLKNVAKAEREFIGEGHSFRVEKAFMETSDAMPHVVVIKRPLFSKGDKTEGSHWSRLLLEVKSLMHPPLAAHTNIVDLLAIGWEGSLSDTSPELEWPILVMSYATHGTLDAFQWSPELESDEKISICLDVACGLNVLHRCGIIHGDLKSENVLIFAEESRPVAKLCDFGCSIIGPQAFGKLVGGSEPWNCPEWKDTMSKENLPLTDVYSFGLLFWRTLSETSRPFQDLAFFAKVDSLTEDDIDGLKRLANDRFLEEVKNSLKSTCTGFTEMNLLEQVLDHTIRFRPRQRSLEDAILKLEELLKLRNGAQITYV
jgi:serine/threonine protein kinase